MGDSTAAGWGAGDLASTYPHQIAGAIAARGFRVHVVNVAVGGATTAQVRRDQSAFLASVRPDVVTLSIGANDATHGTPTRDFKSEMTLLLADLQKSSAKSVMVADVPDMFLAPALPYPLAIISGRRARNLNAILEEMPRGSKLKIVNLYRRGKLDYRRDPGLYAADLFHPSTRGYAIWAHLFEQKLDFSKFNPPKTLPR
jgi:lysophospholipase L1-like esterase